MNNYTSICQEPKITLKALGLL